MIRSKKNVAIVTPFYPPAIISGSSLLNKQLAELFTDNGYNVPVITSDSYQIRYLRDLLSKRNIKSTETLINKIKVIRLKHHRFLTGFAYVFSKYLYFLLPKNLRSKIEIMHYGPYFDNKDLLDKLDNGNFDYIYSSTLPLFLNLQLAEIIHRLKKRPKFIFRPEFHAELPVFYNRNLGNIVNKADLLHIYFPSEKKKLIETFKISKNKFFLQPPVIKIETLNIKEKAVIQFKKKHKLAGKKIILFAGTRNYHKGALFLLRTVQKLFEEDNSFVLLSIGLDSLEWRLAKLFAKKQALIDLGYVNEKIKQISFQVCDIFCLPSVSESFGLVYLEAWLNKKPVIGVNIPTSRELIENNHGGKCVEFGNIAELKKVIYSLINNRALLRNLAENGYQTAMKNFSFKNVSNNLEMFGQ